MENYICNEADTCNIAGRCRHGEPHEFVEHDLSFCREGSECQESNTAYCVPVEKPQLKIDKAKIFVWVGVTLYVIYRLIMDRRKN